MLKLYDLVNSGNCHKVRLLLSFLQIAYEKIPVDTPTGEHQTPDFMRMNPIAHVPVLEVDGRHIWESQAILVYLARKYGGETWLPLELDAHVEVAK